jgi:hypothetical protein
MALDIHPGPYMVNLTFVSSGMFFKIHSALSLAIPSKGSLVGLKALTTSIGTGLPFGQYAPVVVSGTMTKPSTWSGETPASSIARLSARMLKAPTDVSGFPSQRRAVGECPTPTAATFPLCSHNPNPSVVLYIEAGAFWVVIVHSFLRAVNVPGKIWL